MFNKFYSGRSFTHSLHSQAQITPHRSTVTNYNCTNETNLLPPIPSPPPTVYSIETAPEFQYSLTPKVSPTPALCPLLIIKHEDAKKPYSVYFYQPSNQIGSSRHWWAARECTKLRNSWTNEWVPLYLARGKLSIKTSKGWRSLKRNCTPRCGGSRPDTLGFPCLKIGGRSLRRSLEGRGEGGSQFRTWDSLGGDTF